MSSFDIKYHEVDRGLSYVFEHKIASYKSPAHIYISKSFLDEVQKAGETPQDKEEIVAAIKRYGYSEEFSELFGHLPTFPLRQDTVKDLVTKRESISTVAALQGFNKKDLDLLVKGYSQYLNHLEKAWKNEGKIRDVDALVRGIRSRITMFRKLKDILNDKRLSQIPQDFLTLTSSQEEALPSLTIDLSGTNQEAKKAILQSIQTHLTIAYQA